jgi:D-alanine--poly(phosphoribitol) ligase subunit 1
MSLNKQLYDSAIRYSSLTAVKIEDREINYCDLNEGALSIAGVILKLGLKSHNIGIVTQRSFSAYAGILGSIYAGYTYVPINPNYSKDKVVDILIQTNVQVLVADLSDWLEIKKKIQNITSIKHIIFPYDKDISLSGNVNVILKNDLISYSKLVEPRNVDDRINAYITFTSGSTGNPKGVQVTTGNLQSFLNNMARFIDMKPGYVSAQVHDLSFDFSVFQVFFPLITGGTNCVVSAKERYCPSDFIIRENISLWSSVPTIVEIMSKLSLLEHSIFPSLKYSIFCGEPLTQKTANLWLRAAPNSTIENYYGPTETTVFASRYLYKDTDVNKSFHNDIVPIGLPFSNHNMILIDKNNNISQENTIGEIAIYGPQVSPGYLNDIDKTKEVFTSFSWDELNRIWYKTGDLAKYNSCGVLEYIGRKDNQIKIAGRRIEVGEIESILRGQINGCDPVVVPSRDQNGIVISLVAFVTVNLNDSDIIQLNRLCSNLIEMIFFPKKFLYIDEYPTLVSGKIDRKSLEKIVDTSY